MGASMTLPEGFVLDPSPGLPEGFELGAVDPGGDPLRQGPETATGPQPEPSLEEFFEGATEARRGLIEGAIPGSMGYMYGVFEGLYNEIAAGQFGSKDAAQRIAENATLRASQATAPFMPETETGKQIIGEVGEQLGRIPVIPTLAAESQVIAQSAKHYSPC